MRTVIRGIFLLAIVLLWGCKSAENIPYMKDHETFRNTAEQPLYDARIMPKDLLTITVNSIDPDAAGPFNLNIQGGSGRTTGSATPQAGVPNYMVDNNGDIDFPVLGKIHLAGLTKTEAESHIVKLLRSSFKEDPLVTVRSANYKISVLGEVGSPGTFTVANEKINLFEALALAGDMTVQGRRDNVKLLRERADGTKEIVVLDMNKSDVINSPYYYLQQNDILYVEPNKAKARSAGISTVATYWVGITSALLSVANIIVNILRW